MTDDEKNDIQTMIDVSLNNKMAELNRNSLKSLLKSICGKWWFIVMVISLIAFGLSLAVLYYFMAFLNPSTDAIVNSITTIIMTCIIGIVILLLACVVFITIIFYPRHNENE